MRRRAALSESYSREAIDLYVVLYRGILMRYRADMSESSRCNWRLCSGLVFEDPTIEAPRQTTEMTALRVAEHLNLHGAARGNPTKPHTKPSRTYTKHSQTHGSTIPQNCLWALKFHKKQLSPYKEKKRLWFFSVLKKGQYSRSEVNTRNFFCPALVILPQNDICIKHKLATMH